MRSRQPLPEAKILWRRRVLHPVYYGPSHHRQFLIVVEPVPDHGVEVRFHHAMNTGDADEVVVEFTRVQSHFNDQRRAIAEAAELARAGGITWLLPDGDAWIVDGDALRRTTEELATLGWLTGTAAITSRYEAQEMLRAGGGASQGRVILPSGKQRGRAPASHGRKTGS